jgi:hypothetical protein
MASAGSSGRRAASAAREAADSKSIERTPQVSLAVPGQLGLGTNQKGRDLVGDPAPLRPGRAMAMILGGCTAGHADGRLQPGHGPAARREGAPVTRRLLVVVAVMAVMLGLVATPALDETAVGGWFGLPWDGSRGLGQPGQQGEPTASSPTGDWRGGNLSHRRPHARPHPRGHGPKLRRPKGKPDTAGRPARPPARDLHAPPRPARR